MGRAPCCEKMGLKKGPWTPEEDKVLVAHIERHGHGNWRALPKQAGLLRCGKSCRLRWINYLRPDIKRGNFTREEEDTIIQLHELLGNRWSAIAARLPGRTDNEIKNVWHTHLKKRLASNPAEHKAAAPPASPPVSPELSASTSSRAESCMVSSGETAAAGRSASANEESFTSEEFQIDESFWSEALSMPMDGSSDPFGSKGSSGADDVDFWLRLFMEAGETPDLPQV